MVSYSRFASYLVLIFLAQGGFFLCNSVHSFQLISVFRTSRVTVPAGTFNNLSTTHRSELRATWSNGQAIREYQDFLSSGKLQPDQTPDGPSLILTDGSNTPLVTALQKMGTGDDVVLIVENEIFPELPISIGKDSCSKFPIYLALSPAFLSKFLANIPPEYKVRNEDFVFFSGGPIYGCIEPILRRYSYARDSITQVLVSGMTLPLNGQPPRDISVKIGVDSQAQEKRSGECAACGKWQGAIAERMERNEIRCKTGFYREWRRLMWERAAYDAVFHLVGAVRDQPTSVADVALFYEAEASDMLWQISTFLRGSLAVTMMYGFEDRLFQLAELTGKDTPCSLNTAMYDYTFAMFEGCPLIAEYLIFAQQEMGLLKDKILPDAMVNAQVNSNSIMRKGNLRADGVV